MMETLFQNNFSPSLAFSSFIFLLANIYTDTSISAVCSADISAWPVYQL